MGVEIGRMDGRNGPMEKCAQLAIDKCEIFHSHKKGQTRNHFF